MASTDTDRDPLEQLAEEFLERRRQGQSPSIQEYVEKHPQWGERIRNLFPMLLLMEDIKTDPEPPAEVLCPLPVQQGRLPPRLGDYRIVREIGRGGMGVVYEAEQESLGRRVALKVLPSACLASPTRLRRFQREARAAARLHHTNIVPIFGIGHQDDVYYYVMQFIPGHGLDQVLGQLAACPTALWAGPQAARTVLSPAGMGSASTAPTEVSPAEGPPAADSPPVGLSPGAEPALADTQPLAPISQPAQEPVVSPGADYWCTIANIGEQVAEALDYAHQQGILHRDIKPANLLLDNRGTVWISDFGLAKLTDLDDLTHSGDTVGTLRYMAPEQFAGCADARSDVYSLGLTLFELLAMRPAFDETDRRRLVRQVTQEEPPRLGRLNPAIPRDLETIVAKATAANPDHRYQSAGELAVDLRCFLEDRPIHARRITPIGRLWRWCRRNRAVAALAGTAAILLVAVAVVASVGYVRTQQALARVSEQREQAEQARHQAEVERARTKIEHNRAEANLRLATKAFEDVFSKVAVEPVSRPTGEDDEEDWPEAAGDTAVTDRDAAMLESMLKFYDQFAQQNQSDVKLRKETASAYCRVGDIQRRLGQYEKAETAYRRALEFSGAGNESAPRSAEDLRAIAAIYNELGVLLRTTGRFLDARNAHLEAQATLAQEPPQAVLPPETRFELARTYSYLSLSFPGFGPRPPGRGPGAHHGPWTPGARGAEGAANNRRALEILEALTGEDPDNPRYRLAMARSQRDRSLLAAMAGRREEAGEAKQKAVAILEKLVSEAPHNPDYRYELAETYATIFAAPWDPQTSAGALAELRHAIEIGNELVTRYPTVPEYQASLARSQSRLGDSLRAVGASAEAEEQFSKTADLGRTLVADFPTVLAYRFLLARALHQLAEVETTRREPAKARASLEEAIANSEMLQHLIPEGPGQDMMLSMQYAALAKVLRELGEETLAGEAAAKADQAAPNRGPPGLGPFHHRHERPPAGKPPAEKAPAADD